jgi:hypothetical protein
MRTLGFRTQALLAVAAAIGVIASLGRAWYAPSPASAAPEQEKLGELQVGFFASVERALVGVDGRTGWETLGAWGTGIAALAGLAALGALVALVPQLQAAGRELLRAASVLLAGVVVWRLLDRPDQHLALELRQGAVLAMVCAVGLMSFAAAVAAAPLRRRAQRTSFAAPVEVAPVPAPVFDTSASAPPPGA